MIRPASYTLNIIRRSTFNFALRVYETKGGPLVDLSTVDILAQLWDRTRETKYGDFTVDMTDANVGVIVLRLSSAQTIPLATSGIYDVKVIYPDSSEYFILQGSFLVKEGYSDD